MNYKLMRLRKYYDAVRSNTSFNKTSLGQKKKIIENILKYLKSGAQGPLVAMNKPVIAQIEPTSECNLKCEMCIRDKIGVPIGSMSFENFKIVLDKLDSLFKIHFSGQGEVFLNPEWFEMIKYANSRGATVFFTTNGTLLTKSVIEKICELDIGEIGISIDSVSKEKYEKIRKNANFEKVLENVFNLVKELKKSGKKTIVSTSAVIMKDNIKEIPEFVGLANRLGIKKVGFQSMLGKLDYTDKYDKNVREQTEIDYKELKNKIKEAKKIAENNGITLIFDEEKSPGCIWPWRSIYITWEGFVTPCCKILNYRKPYFGNILNDDFWKIWNGKMYQAYRKLLKKRLPPIGCRGCDRV